MKRTYLPLHSVLRVDEVRQQGVSKVSTFEGSNVTPFPVPLYTPKEVARRQEMQGILLSGIIRAPFSRWLPRC